MVYLLTDQTVTYASNNRGYRATNWLVKTNTLTTALHCITHYHTPSVPQMTNQCLFRAEILDLLLFDDVDGQTDANDGSPASPDGVECRGFSGHVAGVPVAVARSSVVWTSGAGQGKAQQRARRRRPQCCQRLSDLAGSGRVRAAGQTLHPRTTRLRLGLGPATDASRTASRRFRYLRHFPGWPGTHIDE